ncbi:unnamed protein product [Durusdinium trenchii]|uniref:Uncharacterized protein n=1 Tax=Durusdinium trenchii TaxID=1381693 RepID=A0ABP0LHU1_9DINO
MQAPNAVAVLVLLVTCLWSSNSLKTFEAEEVAERPVTKVLNLLQGMKKQLETEAEEESELMEKFNCWCKENGEGKATSVEAAEAKIKEMEAKVEELTASSSRLEVESKNLEKDMEKKEVSLEEVIALRKKELAKFEEDETDLKNDIGSVKAATNVVAEGVSLVQRPGKKRAISETLRRILERRAGDLSADDGRHVAMLLQDDPGAGSVEGVLKDLKTDFQKNLEELQDSEKTNEAEHEKLVAAKKKEMDAVKAQMTEKEEQKAATDEELFQTKQAVKDARGSVDEEIAFAKQVKEKCAVKAKEWEKRQKTRAEETLSVSKAIEVLGDDAAHEVFGKTMSFLQVSSSDARVRRAQLAALLSKAGLSGRDERLKTLALEAKLDSFTVVKEKIDTMVGALKEEQALEVKKKDYCVDEFQKNKLASEKKLRLASNLDAQKEELKMKMETATEDLATLQSDIKELQKQQTLASQNREKENSEFQKIVQEQRTTQDLLKKALGILGDFYNKQPESFLQKASVQGPDEPKTFGSYKKSSSNNGVMMMLQQLVAEAKEMEKETTAAEAESQADYEAFGKEAIRTLEKKAKSMADKEEKKAKAEEKLLETKISRKGAKDDLDSLEGTKAELHETCDFTLENFDARQKARAEEVEALKQALFYLSGAKL